MSSTNFQFFNKSFNKRPFFLYTKNKSLLSLLLIHFFQLNMPGCWILCVVCIYYSHPLPLTKFQDNFPSENVHRLPSSQIPEGGALHKVQFLRGEGVILLHKGFFPKGCTPSMPPLPPVDGENVSIPSLSIHLLYVHWIPRGILQSKKKNPC